MQRPRPRNLSARAIPQGLTHVDTAGHVVMVDVSEKAATRRTATAEAKVWCSKATLTAVRNGATHKGDVLATVRIAAIQASKRTSELVPLCHPLMLTKVTVDVSLAKDHAKISATCETVGPTGVEMEAMTAASVGALTFYDMVKAIDRHATFEVALVAKDGGKSGAFRRKKTS